MSALLMYNYAPIGKRRRTLAMRSLHGAQNLLLLGDGLEQQHVRVLARIVGAHCCSKPKKHLCFLAWKLLGA